MERARNLIFVVVAAVLAVGLWFAFGGRDAGRPDVPLRGDVVGQDGEVEPAQAPIQPAGGGRDEVVGSVPGREVVASSGGSGRERGTGSLVVEVRYSTDRQPAVGTVVLVRGIDARGPWDERTAIRTDADGIARLERLAPGAWLIEALRGGRTGAVIEAEAEHRAELTIPPGGTVEGIVVDAGGGPVAGASVWLSEAWRDDRGEVDAIADARGAFVLRDVGLGHTVMAFADGFAASPTYPVHGEADARTALRITLSRDAGAIAGRVTDERGEPIAGARVLVGRVERPADRRAEDGARVRGPAPREVRSDEDGGFLAGFLERGAVPIAVRARGYATWTGAAEVAVGETARVVVTLVPAAVIEGICTGPDGAPRAGVQITFGDSEELGAGDATSGSDGRYRIEDAPVGDIEIRAAGSRLVAAEARLRTTAGAVTRWDPVLDEEAAIDPSAAVSGRVVGIDGRGLPGYQVVAEPDPPAQSTPVAARSQQEGRFEMAVPWPRVRLYAYAPARAGSFPVAFLDGVAAGTRDVRLEYDPATLSALRARILDATGAPVPSASLLIWHETARVWRDVPTGAADGVVAVAPIPPGTCTVEVRSPDHPWQRLGQRVLPPGGTLDLGDLLLEPGARVSGAVTFVDGGAPGTAVTLRFLGPDGREIGVTEVRDGRYRSGVLPLGELTLLVQGEGIAATRFPLALDAAHAERTVDLSIERGVSTRLRLVMAAGFSRPGWMVVHVVKDSGSIWSRGLGRDAALEVEAFLAPGEYRVMVFADQKLGEVPLRVTGAPAGIDVPVGVR